MSLIYNNSFFRKSTFLHPAMHYACFFLFSILFAIYSPSFALEAIRISPQSRAVDILPAAQLQQSRDDRIEIQTARDANGIVRHIEVEAKEPGSRPRWITFAIANETGEKINHLLVAPWFKFAGSGVFWPDLASSRIESVTSSHGYSPNREAAAEADIFRITLDPGAVVTFVAELKSSRLPELTFWDPDAYKEKQNALTLYRGIVTGITSLLAIFLTIILTLRAALIFPAAAALSWAVLVYIGVDFGFIGKLFNLRPEVQNVYRASSEAILGGALLVFLFAYLNLNRWHARYVHVTLVWLLLLGLLVAMASMEPAVASGIARISIAVITIIGFILVVFLALNRYDRATMLLPTWFMLVVWVTAAILVVNGYISNDIASSALIGGLVLLVLLIGFTVMQNVFTSTFVMGGITPDANRKALAFVGGGDFLFDWDVSDDYLNISPDFEVNIGLERGHLEGVISKFIDTIHYLDRDIYCTILNYIIENRRGKISKNLRFIAQDGNILHYSIRARPVINREGEVVRVVGTLTDVTASQLAQDRLMRDAIHDHLSGLPNRNLLLDRLETALISSKIGDNNPKPTLIVVDIDRFKRVNEQVGIGVADVILLTIARRLARIVRTGDTLARIAGDSFGLVLLSEQDPHRILSLADLARRAISTPISNGDKQIYLTGSVGVAFADEVTSSDKEALLRNAELACLNAKKAGRDKVEIYRASMRSVIHDKISLSNDLKKAIDRKEFEVYFQPVVRLEDRSVAGFEALVRWNHPKMGRLLPAEFISIAEENGSIIELGAFIFETAARELFYWQQNLILDIPLFVSVNVPSSQLIRQDLSQDIKNVLIRYPVQHGSLKLAFMENMLMDNAEYSIKILHNIKDLGVSLALDGFGTGFTSFSYLQRFNFDALKIDQSFIKHDETGKRSLILRSLISIANDLSMTTIAEGTETEADTVELFQLGCEFAQGYVFGHAMNIEQTRKFIGISV